MNPRNLKTINGARSGAPRNNSESRNARRRPEPARRMANPDESGAVRRNASRRLAASFVGDRGVVVAVAGPLAMVIVGVLSFWKPKLAVPLKPYIVYVRLEKVLEAMEPFYTDKFYNPSATYLAAKGVSQDLAAARAKVCASLALSEP